MSGYEMRTNENGIEECWSVYQQRWIPAMFATDAEIAALPTGERERVIKLVQAERESRI